MNHLMKWTAAFLLAMVTGAAAWAAPLELKRGDHICLIGNTLADRMQHDGWLETLIQSRFPKARLVVRDLGFSGDELTLRLRSEGFGSPDQWLSFHQAGVVFAFFGYNESFAGQAGLDKFKKDLDAFIKHTLGQKYNGKSPPRLVVFSPIAHENLHNRNLPDGRLNNKRLALYTQALAEVAKANHVLFVDLFQPTQKLYAKESQPLTINGVHLNSYGNWLVARIIDRALFPQQSALTQDQQAFEKLRRAVLDKNFYWFNRYRTVDGYNVYGGRSYLRYVDGISNRVVLQREMQVLDVMAANRDKRIWAVAQGGDLKVDDRDTPPFIPVKTNMPGPGPHGEHFFLDGQEAIKKMTAGKGLQIHLFASEKDFPELAKPVQMAFDTKGRLWVAVWPSYPHWKPKEEMNDKLLILEDTDGDGKADKCTVFADHLHCPTGFAFYNGGVIVAQAPGLVFLKDTKGNGKADVRVRILEGIDSADTHHTANSFTFDPGGALYFQEGIFHHTQVETPYGPPVRNANAGVYRYEPRTQKFGVYIPYGFANPHGHVFDYWGQDIVYDGTGANPYDAALICGHRDFPYKHPNAPQVYQQRTRPCPGVEILSSRHFPKEYQGNLLVANVIGLQGILRYRVEPKGSSFAGTELEPIVYSTDPNFRPSDIKIGPDGAIYFLDWQNPIIGHMQHHLRDPSRDRAHGRIYRVTYKDRPLLKPAEIAGAPMDKLLDLLKEPEDRVRYRAKIELGGRDSDQVITAVQKWLNALDKNDPSYEHDLMEALWVYQYHNVVNEPLLRRMLRSRDYRARAAATRVLRYWRDRVSHALDLLETQANDEHPRVRLQALVALSDFTTPRAAEIALAVLKHPMDSYLRYALKETMAALEPYWKQAVASGRPFAAKNPAGVDYVLGHVNTADLVKMARSAPVYRALLSRQGILHDYRHEALKGLAKIHQTDDMAELLAAIARNDKLGTKEALNALQDLAHILLEHAACDLEERRQQVEHLATKARQPFTRQIAYAALIVGDNSVEKTWASASKSVATLSDLVNGVPAVPDAKLRAAIYPKVEPLLHGLPKALTTDVPDQKGAAASLRRDAINAVTFIEGHEAETFTTLARFIKEGLDRDASVRAIRRIPKSKWPADRMRPLIGVLIAHVSQLPAAERTEPAVLDELQLGNDLASRLPLKEAREVRARLSELGVQVVVIRTIPHQMVYDRTKFYVEANKPVVVVLENDDIMPHNLLITAVGALQEIGTAAERMATEPDAFARGFIPRSSKVLHAMRMVQPRQIVRLQFTAPKTPGEYPYVCTFPGHWRLMHGTMHVVPKLADVSPEDLQPPAASDTQARPFVRNWSMDDLVPFLHQLDTGRSFDNGQKMFTAASCIQCHTVGKAGGILGPNLNELPKKLADKKFTRKDVLREIVHPSEVINENYKTYLIETTKGELVTGIIVSQDKKVMRVMTNPLQKPREIPIQDIEEKRESKVSMMPEGLLTTLSKDEILDLVAYILSGGDPNRPPFKK